MITKRYRIVASYPTQSVEVAAFWSKKSALLELIILNTLGNTLSERQLAIWDNKKGIFMRCPTCDSPEPRMHPATQVEGEVMRICEDNFHSNLKEKMKNREWT